jgi:hypothetical protein
VLPVFGYLSNPSPGILWRTLIPWFVQLSPAITSSWADYNLDVILSWLDVCWILPLRYPALLEIQGKVFHVIIGNTKAKTGVCVTLLTD